MNWTTPIEIRRQVQRLWDRGKLLASTVNDAPLFPYRLTLKGPASAEFMDGFSAIREWIDSLRKGESRGYRIVWREVNHRVIGRNSLPKEIWIDSHDQALSLIGKHKDAQIFMEILTETRQRHPLLLPWLARHPLRALELAGEWTRLLDIVAWLQAKPRSGIYLRQINIPGVHTKFIETHRGILSELLDLTLPPEAIRADATGAANFCRRYGFREKPQRIRFRLLDTKQTIFPGAADQDITITHDTFASLDFPVRRVFITENEINFLAFPSVAESLVIFGAGYGFEMLAKAHWLRNRDLFYWGDIDTHGFAILDHLRAQYPHVKSLLMDRETLLYHRLHWVKESQPETRDLIRLTNLKNELYDELRHHRLDLLVRLEQERIDYSWVERALHLIG